MRIVRLVFSLLFLLGGVLAALLSFLTYSNPQLTKIVVSLERVVPGIGGLAPILAEGVPLWGAQAAAAAALLLVAAWVWPKNLFKEIRMRRKIRKAQRKRDAPAGVGPASASGKSALEPVQSGGAGALAEEMDTEPGEGEESPGGAPAAVDPDAEADLIQELVNREQLNISPEIARQIIERGYPELAGILPLFHNGDSMVSFSRQVIAVLRNKFKLKDKGLSSYQFAQFQEKVYQLEEDKLFYQYTPQDRSVLDEFQRECAGKIFDLTTYRITQQKLHASREDWTMLSLKNAGTEALGYHP